MKRLHSFNISTSFADIRLPWWSDCGMKINMHALMSVSLRRTTSVCRLISSWNALVSASLVSIKVSIPERPKYLMVAQSFKASNAFDPIHGVICPKGHCVFRIRSELVEMFARDLGSLSRANEHMYEIQRTLCGSIVTESASSMPRIL